MRLAVSNHAAERYIARVVGRDLPLSTAKSDIAAAVEFSRPATIEEAAMIRAASKGAAFMCHESTEYRVLQDRIVFVIGPGRKEPGARVVVTCYVCDYLVRAA